MCGIKRYPYTVAPGLYGVGSPDTNSEVMVTANFKLSFDHLRKHLDDINAWTGYLYLTSKGFLKKRPWEKCRSGRCAIRCRVAQRSRTG